METIDRKERTHSLVVIKSIVTWIFPLISKYEPHFHNLCCAFPHTVSHFVSAINFPENLLLSKMYQFSCLECLCEWVSRIWFDYIENREKYTRCTVGVYIRIVWPFNFDCLLFTQNICFFTKIYYCYSSEVECRLFFVPQATNTEFQWIFQFHSIFSHTFFSLVLLNFVPLKR